MSQCFTCSPANRSVIGRNSDHETTRPADVDAKCSRRFHVDFCTVRVRPSYQSTGTCRSHKARASRIQSGGYQRLELPSLHSGCGGESSSPKRCPNRPSKGCRVHGRNARAWLIRSREANCGDPCALDLFRSLTSSGRRCAYDAACEAHEAQRGTLPRTSWEGLIALAMKSSPAQQIISALERARWSAKARITAVDEQGLVNSRRIYAGCKPRRASHKSSVENPETESRYWRPRGD